MGSPPLVRERLLATPPAMSQRGITPARAGKTGCYVIADDGKRDHPHSCGKDCSLFLVPTKGLGSPPLVRERLLRIRNTLNFFRITPARAGKTYIQLFSQPRS